MINQQNVKTRKIKSIAKCPTGISGVDEITDGGLPKGRITLLSGSAGCGKTLFSSEFLLNGAIDHNEPGLFIAFEEVEDDLIENIQSIGYDVHQFIKDKKITFQHIHIDRAEFVEAGGYNLDGLFIQIEYLVKTRNIKRIVLDTIEVLFSQLKDEMLLRSELQRLFQWIKTKKLTAIVTAETGSNFLSRHGLEEYVADCVILLDNRIINELSTRRLRIVKYRGSSHGGNEYPFIIAANGIVVLPITSLKQNWIASSKRISTGIKRLDNMLDGKGFFVGSNILISGVAGSGKSSIACTFAASVCSGGQRCLYFSFEESVSQIVRNMKSINLDVDHWIKKNLLEVHAIQPYSHGLESHLVILYNMIEAFKPAAIIIDPISNLDDMGEPGQVKALFSRLINYVKQKQITVLSTSLISGNHHQESQQNISSLMDTWILLQNIEGNGELNRVISVLKSRGMKHSNQVREVIICDKGIDFVDVYIGEGKVLAGSARLQQEEIDSNEKELVANELLNEKHRIMNKLAEIKSKIKTSEAELQLTYDEIKRTELKALTIEKQNLHISSIIAKNRMVDVNPVVKVKRKVQGPKK